MVIFHSCLYVYQRVIMEKLWKNGDQTKKNGNFMGLVADL